VTWPLIAEAESHVKGRFEELISHGRREKSMRILQISQPFGPILVKTFPPLSKAFRLPASDSSPTAALDMANMFQKLNLDGMSDGKSESHGRKWVYIK
jgi:hypothetical protein